MGSADERRGEYQRHDCHDLDEDVHGRTGGVLEGISHRVTDHRRLVVVSAFAAVGSGFDVLLSVVPRTTGVGHEDRQAEASHQGAG